MNIIVSPENAVNDALPPHGDALYEIINGECVELPPMSVYSVRVVTVLTAFLETFARTKELGRTIAEALFPLSPNEKTRRRPDVAFVSYERWPKDRRLPHTDPWLVIPELVVEVVSPTDLAEELRIRIAEYLQLGVRQVWVVYPKPNLVDVYQGPGGLRTLGRADELDGGDILPGFRLPLTSVFETASDNGTPDPT